MTGGYEEHKTRMAQREDITADHVEIRLPADPACLCIVRAAVQKAAEMAGFDEQEVDGVTLALEEALANAIRHSYGGPCKELIVVRLRKVPPGRDQAAGLEIIVRDFGRQVDPQEIKGRALEEVRPGGLGVHIIQSSMDEVEYTCPADGGMQLRMFKVIGSSDGAGPRTGHDKSYD